MKGSLALLSMPLALAACATLPVIDPAPAGAYAPLDPASGLFRFPEDAATDYLERANVGDASVETQVGRDGSGLGTRVVLVTTDGYRDDSVRGEQWRIVLGQSDLGFRVLQAGIRYNCARGENPGWSSDLCP